MCIGAMESRCTNRVPEVYSVPMIAGQAPDYIVKALQAYRAGDRSHPSMQGVAKSLSDQDMADLAAYYGGAGQGGQMTGSLISPSRVSARRLSPRRLRTAASRPCPAG